MSRHDIRIWRQVDDGLASYPLTTGMTFVEGEVVVVAAAGTLSEAGDDPATVTGISAASSQGMNAVGELGTLADQVRPNGTQIQVYKPTAGQLFRGMRFATDGAGTAATPALSNVGDTAGFTFTGGNWIVDTGTANIHVEIVAVLDSRGSPLGDTTIRTVGDGDSVIFGFI